MTAKYQRCGPPKRAGIVASAMILVFAIATILAVVVPYHDNAPFVSKSSEHSSHDIQHYHDEDSHHSSDTLTYAEEGDEEWDHEHSDHDHDHESSTENHAVSPSVISSLTVEEKNLSTETESTASTAIQKTNLFDRDENASNTRVQPTKTTENQVDNNQDSTCIDYLSEADTNSDGLIQIEEYASFVSNLQRMLPIPVNQSMKGSISSSYSDLPYELKVNFLHLSCLCDDECCELGSAWGIYIGGDLHDICARTEETLVNYFLIDGAADDGSRRLDGEDVLFERSGFLRSDNGRKRL